MLSSILDIVGTPGAGFRPDPPDPSSRFHPGAQGGNEETYAPGQVAGQLLMLGSVPRRQTRRK